MPVLLVAGFILAACGRAEVDIQSVDPADATALYIQQATQRPNADEFLLYEDEQSGIYFHYPAAWQVQAQRGLITVIGNGLRLTIKQDTMATESTSATPSPDSDPVLVASDYVEFLGDLYSTYHDENARQIYFTDPDETNPFMIANVHLSIWLEVEVWPPKPSSRQLVNAVVGSLGFTWLRTGPPSSLVVNWQTYTDPETGLQFDYPPDWQVVHDSNAIIVSKDDIQLILGLSVPTGLPAGDLRKGDPTHIWLNRTAVPRVHLLYEDQVKAVYYGPPMTQIPISDQLLVISATGTESARYEDLDISPDIRQQMDWIVLTLRSVFDLCP